MRAGLSYFRAAVLREAGRSQEAELAFRSFLAELPVEFVPETHGSEAYSDFPR